MPLSHADIVDKFIVWKMKVQSLFKHIQVDLICFKESKVLKEFLTSHIAWFLKHVAGVIVYFSHGNNWSILVPSYNEKKDQGKKKIKVCSHLRQTYIWEP